MVKCNKINCSLINVYNIVVDCCCFFFQDNIEEDNKCGLNNVDNILVKNSDLL